MKRLFRTLILCVCFVAVHTHAWSEALVVGISEGYPPYYYKQNGKITGVCVEVIDAVAREIGIEVVYKEFPWKRLMLSAEKGEVDAIMPLFKTEEREKYLKFNGLELASETNHFFTTDDSAVSYEGHFEELSQFRIGVVSEYSYGERFDSFEFQNKVITLSDKHLIEMFMYNRFDVGVGNRYVVHYYADMAGIAQNVKFLDPPIAREMLYLGFAKKGNHYSLAEKFAENLQAFKATTEYHVLVEKFGMSGQH